MTMFIAKAILVIYSPFFSPQKRSTFYGIPSCHDMFMGMFLGKGHFSSTNTYAPIYASHGAGICTLTCAQNPKISCWSLFKKNSTMGCRQMGSVPPRRVNPRHPRLTRDPLHPVATMDCNCPWWRHAFTQSAASAMYSPACDDEGLRSAMGPGFRVKKKQVMPWRQNGRSTWRRPWPWWPWPDLMAIFFRFHQSLRRFSASICGIVDGDG